MAGFLDHSNKNKILQLHPSVTEEEKINCKELIEKIQRLYPIDSICGEEHDLFKINSNHRIKLINCRVGPINNIDKAWTGEVELWNENSNKIEFEYHYTRTHAMPVHPVLMFLGKWCKIRSERGNTYDPSKGNIHEDFYNLKTSISDNEFSFENKNKGILCGYSRKNNGFIMALTLKESIDSEETSEYNYNILDSDFMVSHHNNELGYYFHPYIIQE